MATWPDRAPSGYDAVIRLLILAVLAIAALFWARVVYGLIFRQSGARPGDPSWSEPEPLFV